MGTGEFSAGRLTRDGPLRIPVLGEGGLKKISKSLYMLQRLVYAAPGLMTLVSTHNISFYSYISTFGVDTL